MKLDEFKLGWVVGNFQPTLIRTEQLEVAIKYYKKGQLEPRHHHRIATEWTIVVKGKVHMRQTDYQKGDVIVIKPGESTSFRAIEDSITVVIKTPSVTSDKYIDNEDFSS